MSRRARSFTRFLSTECSIKSTSNSLLEGVEVRNISSKGRGLIAGRSIPSNTKILIERPLLSTLKRIDQVPQGSIMYASVRISEWANANEHPNEPSHVAAIVSNWNRHSTLRNWNHTAVTPAIMTHISNTINILQIILHYYKSKYHTSMTTVSIP